MSIDLPRGRRGRCNCGGHGMLSKDHRLFLAVSNYLVAQWASPAARTGDATGGCSFMCETGSCRVGFDGLPVELLQFGVE